MKVNKLPLVLAISTALLTACGGDSSSVTTLPSADIPSTGITISGVAAAGAPLVGTVTVKDSTGATKTVTIGTNGGYEVDVSDMTAPFMFRASGTVGGRSYVIHSAGTEADIDGNINVTTLTDLIIANIAGDIASNYFDGDNFSGLTASEIDTQEAVLQERIQAVLSELGVESSIDLMRSSFTPDHTQLDAALDILNVSVDPDTNVATITNIINNDTITDDLTITTDNSTLTDTTGVSTAVSDIDGIVNTFSSFTTMMATSLPTATQFGTLVDVGFLDNDRNKDTWIAQFTSDPALIGLSIDNIAIESMDTTANTAIVSFNVSIGDQSFKITNFGMKKDATSGAWLLWGNRYLFDIEMYTQTGQLINSNGVPDYMTGIQWWVENPDPSNDGGTVTNMVVTGPGLPGGSLDYSYDPINFGSQFILTYLISEGYYHPWYIMNDDAAINSIPDNASYNLAFTDATGTVLASYDLTLPKRPYTNGELPSLAFPAITSPTTAQFSAYNGGRLDVTAELPTATTTAHVYLNYSTQLGDSQDADIDVYNISNGALNTSITLADVTPGDSIFRRHLGVEYSDNFDRLILTGMD